METRLQRYCECMDLLKLRIDIVREIATGKRTTGFLVPDQELCCLQLRKSLELVAFAGISANLDKYSQMRPKFHEDWNGKRIILTIEKINPNFYPIPIRTFADDKGQLHYDDIKDGYLRKEDFVELYDWCGQQLHSFNPFQENSQWKDVKERLVLESSRIVTLLNQHRCILPESDDEIWVNMNDSGHDGKATAYIFRKILDGQQGVVLDAQNDAPR
jgi:hypothetical protein